jgi:hypothetical protein
MTDIKTLSIEEIDKQINQLIVQRKSLVESCKLRVALGQDQDYWHFQKGLSPLTWHVVDIYPCSDCVRNNLNTHFMSSALLFPPSDVKGYLIVDNKSLVILTDTTLEKLNMTLADNLPNGFRFLTVQQLEDMMCPTYYKKARQRTLKILLDNPNIKDKDEYLFRFGLAHYSSIPKCGECQKISTDYHEQDGWMPVCQVCWSQPKCLIRDVDKNITLCYDGKENCASLFYREHNIPKPIMLCDIKGKPCSCMDD